MENLRSYTSCNAYCMSLPPPPPQKGEVLRHSLHESASIGLISLNIAAASIYIYIYDCKGGGGRAWGIPEISIGVMRTKCCCALRGYQEAIIRILGHELCLILIYARVLLSKLHHFRIICIYALLSDSYIADIAVHGSIIDRIFDYIHIYICESFQFFKWK